MEVDDYTIEKQNEDIVPIDVMSNIHLGDIIEDPKQRMLYEYNFVHPALFFISLIEVKEDGDEAVFPKILHTEGNIDIDQMDDDDMDDEEAYENLMEDGYDEDDLRELGFGSDDDLYDDDFYGEDAFGNDDY
jgi:hypothetical protein